TVAWLGAEVGEAVAVGAPLVKLTVEGGKEGEAAAEPAEAAPAARLSEPDRGAEEKPVAAPQPEPRPAPERLPEPEPARRSHPAIGGTGGLPRPEGERPLASPAVRLRAREAGIDLRQVPGSGPAGRITHEDLDAFTARGPAAGPRRRSEVEEIRIV